MIKKSELFLTQAEHHADAVQMLIQATEKLAGEPEIIDFKAPSQLAAALKRSDSAFAVVAAPENIFLKTKIALIKQLGEKVVRSSTITAALGENSPLSDKEIEVHSAMPAGATAVATANGEFSAFTYEKRGKTVIFMPLISDKLEELIPKVFGVAADKAKPSGFRKSLNTVVSSGKKIAVAPMGLSGALMAVVSSIEGGKETFALSQQMCQPAQGETPDNLTARAAKLAKESSAADFGAAVSDIETDETGAKSVLVCLADSERARAARVYSEDDESPKQLAGAAMIKLCEMMEETAQAGALINPDAPKKAKPKKNPVLPIIITAIGIAAAVIICLLIAFFAGEKTDSEPTTAGNAYLKADNLAVQAITPESTTAPFEEESKDFRGGSGIGDELDFFGSGLLGIEASTQVTVSAEQTASVPVSAQTSTKPAPSTTSAAKTTAAQKTTAAPKTTSAPKTTAAPKPTAAATKKPTQAATTKPSESKSSGGTFVFTSYGWGHGVGMSQEGAIAMAKNGKDYKQILANYYPGTTVKEDSSAPEKVKYGGIDYGLIEYLCKTSYREIGNSAPEEAIKAQIVAVYTFSKTYNFNVDSSRHAFSAGWAYEGTATHKACLEVLGMASETSSPKAVYVDYNGSPAFTCYFASSPGKTASASSVWGGSYSYLSGGSSSPEKVDVATFEISSEDMKKLILDYDSSIVLGDDPSQWIKIVSHDSAYNSDIGYASVVRVGNKEMRGNHFRSNVCDYQLRSHCFTVKYIPD